MYTTISVKVETKKQLAKYGNKGETWDELLSRLLNQTIEATEKNARV